MALNEIVGMSNTQIDKLKKDGLSKILKSVITELKEAKPDPIMDLLTQIQADNNENFRKLNERLDSITDTIKEDIREEFQPKFEKISEQHSALEAIVNKQQTFMEQLDIAQRANNIIISGVPENSILTYNGRTATSDKEKTDLILAEIGSKAEVKDVCRLGRDKESPSGKRPMKVTLVLASDRPEILSKAESLFQKNIPLKEIRIKKDTHLAVRKEWWRIHERFREERRKEENADSQILIDYDSRQLLKNGEVIDTFRPNFM